MKKVLALVLAVMMVATVAFAAESAGKVSSVNPGGSVKVDAEKGFKGGATKVLAEATSAGLIGTVTISQEAVYLTSDKMDDETAYEGYDDSGRGYYKKPAVVEEGSATQSVVLEKAGEKFTNSQKEKLEEVYGSDIFRAAPVINGNVIKDISDIIFRDITNENYSVSSIRVSQGKNYVNTVRIVDADQEARVVFHDNLNVTNPVEFDVSYTLRGKGKMVIKDEVEQLKYMLYTGKYADITQRVTIPSVKFTMHGKVGYGKVKVSIGKEADQDLDGLPEEIDKDKDVVEFQRSDDDIGKVTRTSRAGSYVADAILTEDYDEGLTLEARVYDGDKIFFKVNYDPDRDIVGSLADHDGDLDFYQFTTQSEFIKFNSNAKLIFNDATEDDQVYKVVNKKLFPIGNYDEDEGCWVVKERTLGTYVISDINLDSYVGGSDDIANPDTGANDVVGIATALAAVALVSAAAISLKK